MVGAVGFMGLSVTEIAEEDGVEASSLVVGLGFGRCGWGGCGRRGRVYWWGSQFLIFARIDMGCKEDGRRGLTAPCAGYWRASAM